MVKTAGRINFLSHLFPSFFWEKSYPTDTGTVTLSIFFFSFTCMFKSYLALLVVVRVLGGLDVSVIQIQLGVLVISFSHLTVYFCLAAFFNTGKNSAKFL